ncbi:MAG: tRNA glutamyl-Q(34) synthetase GluQRS [Microthrixaceae bacterium]
MLAGRFAPSPSGSLHLGNLRTACVAWAVARQNGAQFFLRFEDLTTGAAPVAQAEQFSDLSLLGLTFDGKVTRQSERTGFYADAIKQLEQLGLTYDCYCSRREVREAAAAPHGAAVEGRYPQTCSELTQAQIRKHQQAGRRPALRLRAELANSSLLGIDDFVLRRADGVAAYNLAVVVDDAAAGIDHVVRGDDLVETTPRQLLLQELLGYPRPSYFHVPLVLGPDGERLSKRHGAVGLNELLAHGYSIEQVLGLFAGSLGSSTGVKPITAAQLLFSFSVQDIPAEPWVFDPTAPSSE